MFNQVTEVIQNSHSDPALAGEESHHYNLELF